MAAQAPMRDAIGRTCVEDGVGRVYAGLQCATTPKTVFTFAVPPGEAGRFVLLDEDEDEAPEWYELDLPGALPQVASSVLLAEDAEWAGPPGSLPRVNSYALDLPTSPRKRHRFDADVAAPRLQRAVSSGLLKIHQAKMLCAPKWMLGARSCPDVKAARKFMLGARSAPSMLASRIVAPVARAWAVVAARVRRATDDMHLVRVKLAWAVRGRGPSLAKLESTYSPRMADPPPALEPPPVVEFETGSFFR